MRLLTNIGGERIADLLPLGVSLRVASTAISIPGMAKLQSVHTLQRMLLSSEPFLRTDQEDRRRRNSLTLRGDGLASLSWIGRAEVRVTDLPLRQSLLLCGSAPTEQAFLGDCDLTTAGLGLAPSRAAGMIQLLNDPAEIAGVTHWFDELWRRSHTPSPDPLTVALHEATAAYAGDYTCIATNAFGSTQSATATLALDFGGHEAGSGLERGAMPGSGEARAFSDAAVAAEDKRLVISALSRR